MLFNSTKSEIERLASLIYISKNSIVADVGAGKGNYSIAMAKLLGPAGKIYAVEFDPGRISTIGRIGK